MLTSRKTFWLLFWIFAILYIADFFLTKNYLAKVGSYGEYNPAMRYIVDHYGVNGIFWVKASTLTFLALMIYKLRPGRFMGYGLISLNVIAAGIASFGIYINMAV